MFLPQERQGDQRGGGGQEETAGSGVQEEGGDTNKNF